MSRKRGGGRVYFNGSTLLRSSVSSRSPFGSFKGSGAARGPRTSSHSAPDSSSLSSSSRVGSSEEDEVAADSLSLLGIRSCFLVVARRLAAGAPGLVGMAGLRRLGGIGKGEDGLEGLGYLYGGLHWDGRGEGWFDRAGVGIWQRDRARHRWPRSRRGGCAVACRLLAHALHGSKMAS